MQKANNCVAALNKAQFLMASMTKSTHVTEPEHKGQYAISIGLI